MREDVIREIVTRMMTDPNFLTALRNTPGKALRGYSLSEEELAAISSNADGGLGIGRLETRISAATTRPMFGTEDESGCGCVNVVPKKCK